MRAKEFIQVMSESTTVHKNNTVTPAFIENYIAKIHTGGTAADDEELLQWIYSFDNFKLVVMNLDSIETRYSGLNSDKVSEYDKRPNPPPIVIDGDSGWIIDGYHRANAAKNRGDKTIRVYVGQHDVAEKSL